MEYADRIPYQTWINSQLSVARFYGGIILNGKEYFVESGTNDLVVKSLKNKAKQRKAKKDRYQQSMDWKQGRFVEIA